MSSAMQLSILRVVGTPVRFVYFEAGHSLCAMLRIRVYLKNQELRYV
jgi:hypothetical protein